MIRTSRTTNRDVTFSPRYYSRGELMAAYFITGVFSLITLFPIFIMVSVSLMPSQGLASQLFYLWPTHVRIANYVSMWFHLPVARLLLNSIIISVGSAFVALLVGIPAGYALSRTQVFGRRVWLFVFLATQMFSPSMIIVSAYHVMTILHLTDTFGGLILIDSGFYGLPFVVWIIAGYMRHIPQEMEEAVEIDGASSWQKLWRIFVPISAPAIAVAGVYAFISSWNDFAFSLTLATSQSIMPLPIGVYSFMGAYNIQWNYLMGSSLVATVPVLILFLILQRRLTSGIMAGTMR